MVSYVLTIGQSEPAPMEDAPPWMDGWMGGSMVGGQDTFFSLGSCSQVNFPIVEGSQIGYSSNWMTSKWENEGGVFGVGFTLARA